VHNQNALARSHPGGQRKRSTVSVHGEHAAEFTEGFLEYVLPENMHGDRQFEPLASSERSAWPNPYAHDKPNVESRPV
ncbi:MAG: hypothetical protein WA867_17445, partial [Candidatus Acidiferrales bacterium]